MGRVRHPPSVDADGVVTVLRHSEAVETIASQSNHADSANRPLLMPSIYVTTQEVYPTYLCAILHHTKLYYCLCYTA